MKFLCFTHVSDEMRFYSEYLYKLWLVIMFLYGYIEDTTQTIHGRYTRNLIDYELLVPHRVTSQGELISFKLPQYFEHDYQQRFRRHAIPDEEKLHYNIVIDGEDHHVELWPNHGFVSPNLVQEVYRSNVPVAKRRIKRTGNNLCQYVGRVKGQANSKSALSLCDGLAGYLMTDKGLYFIEPVAEHQPNANGEHVHVIYKRELQGTSFSYPSSSGPPMCATHEHWSTAWSEQLRKQHSKRSDSKAQEQSGNIHSLHRYLELLVVADKKFIDYHKDVDVETYVMTIMNMVSNYYHDSTTGNQLDVIVVRIMYLEKEEEYTDLMISQNAEETLDSFCQWALSINPADKKNPQHHDIAVLLTRHDLCSDNVTDCNLMGLAFVASACDPEKACGINEDSGLALGITVTHEMGHIMGCGHDNGEDSPCLAETEDGGYYIMSPYVHMSTTKWSTCSKTFITELFENGLGNCLNDEPEESLFQATNMPPGSVYGSDFQCNLDFPGSTTCKLDQVKLCEKLFCKTGATCHSKGEPPADGTKCGENMWCYNGECVEIGQRPKAIDGGWSEWKEWSDCSRTCGGGVTYSERDCDNPQPQHRGRYCIGERKRVKLCNTNPCPEGSKPFREVQCTEFDSKPFKDRLHTWKPFAVDDEPCKLFCLNENRVYVELAPRVKDGTPCKAGTRNKCIFGVCRKVGCDWEIDSTAVEDQCGDCNGDGSHCKIIEEVYKETGNGYKKIVTIPKDARKILVTEEKSSMNTIAVSAEDEKTFYLNGNFTEANNGDYDFGGVRGVYDHPSTDLETLIIAGPLKKPIVLHQVFYNSENPGIRYKYAVPLPGGSAPVIKPTYNWDFLEFGECSARCDAGIKISKPVCVEKKQGKVGDKFCENLPKPSDRTMECNEQPCKTKWRTGGWGKCSGCKSRSGIKTRKVECVREEKEAGRDPVITEDENCTDPKPAAKQLCCSNEPCPKKRRMTDEVEEKIAALYQMINRNQPLNEYQYENRQHLNLKRSYSETHGPEDYYMLHPDRYTKYLNSPVKHSRRAAHARKYVRNSNGHQKLYPRTFNESKIVRDNVPAQQFKLIEVPLKESHHDVKLTDSAYEAEGDKVVDTLDFCHTHIYTGKQAEEALKEVKKNHTMHPE